MIRPGVRNSPLGLRRPTLQRSQDRFGFRTRDAATLIRTQRDAASPNASYDVRVRARNARTRPFASSIIE